MKYADVLKYYGSTTEAARQLGYTHQAVSRWQRHGISKGTQDRIELITRGKLKADRK